MIPVYRRFLAPSGLKRLLHTSRLLSQDSSKKTSLFGNITQTNDETISRISEQANLSTKIQQEGEVDQTEAESQYELLKKQMREITVENDTRLKAYHEKMFPNLIATEEFLTPLKLKIYNEVIRKYGFFKNNEIVKITSENNETKKYRLNLSPKEIEVLEPSIYLRSFRLKSSMKKITPVARALSQLSLKDAINQCHFSDKKMAHEIGKLLESGLEKAKALSLNPNELYISQIWSGSDGSWNKRMDWKGRGRVGIITHRYSHVRVILKGKQTKDRLNWEKQEKENKKKSWEQLPNEKIRGVCPSHFKW